VVTGSFRRRSVRRRSHLLRAYLQVGITLGAALGLVQAGARDPSQRQIFSSHPGGRIPSRSKSACACGRQGKIHYLGGKQSWSGWVLEGQTPVGVLVHAHSALSRGRCLSADASNGFLAKSIRFHGKPAQRSFSSRRDQCPERRLPGDHHIHAQRETFREDDKIRVHPIITKGRGSSECGPLRRPDGNLRPPAAGLRPSPTRTPEWTARSAPGGRRGRSGLDPEHPRVPSAHPGPPPVGNRPAQCRGHRRRRGAGAGGFEEGPRIWGTSPI